jgi:hypothetical protein
MEVTMQAHRMKVTIPENHQLEIAVRLPEDFPSGPAEVIVLAEPPEAKTRDEIRQQQLALIDELRHVKRSEEEERVLDEFEEFRRTHPFRIESLGDEREGSSSTRTRSTTF